MIRMNHARPILWVTVSLTYPGEGQGVTGDGFVPSRAALLEGATQLAQHVDTHTGCSLAAARVAACISVLLPLIPVITESLYLLL